MASEVDKLAKTVKGKPGLAIEAYARALRQIPAIIADNGGTFIYSFSYINFLCFDNLLIFILIVALYKLHLKNINLNANKNTIIIRIRFQ